MVFITEENQLIIALNNGVVHIAHPNAQSVYRTNVI